MLEKGNNEVTILDIASLVDKRMEQKEIEKVEKYQELKREIKNLGTVKKVKVIPVKVGVLVSKSKETKKWLGKNWG